MSAPRAVLGALGLAAAAYGAFRLLELGLDNLVAAVVWLGGGVLLHDGVLAPLTLLVAALGTRLLPRPWRAPAAAGLLLLGALTVAAVPVLGRFGARADNPTLLDRDYRAGWLVVAAVVLLAVIAWGLVRERAVRRDAAERPGGGAE